MLRIVLVTHELQVATRTVRQVWFLGGTAFALRAEGAPSLVAARRSVRTSSAGKPRGTDMPALSDLADDERTARMVLSMLVEPNDRVTGRLLARLGAVGTLWLAEHDSAVVGLSAVDAQVWRGHFDVPAVKDIASRLDQIHQSGVRALIPGDADWPAALDDLGVGAPYVLWARGASSFLARPVQDFITITRSRASTSYGDHVARELAASVAADERVVVAGGAYGIDGAVHQAALAAGGDTIAILANGVDRPYPAGHRDLLERVADAGLLVSEVPPGTLPTRIGSSLARG